MTSGHPEVSVVIPTRDRFDLLQIALRSALAQQGVEMEVIVVDDASADGTPERLAGIHDERLRVIVNERNLGVAGARNAGIQASRGEWVAFLDDDDFWSPDKLRAGLRDARAEQAEWLYGALVFIDIEGRPTRIRRAPSPVELPRLLAFENVVGGPSGVMVRRELLERTGGFDERLSTLADWDLWLRLNGQGAAATCQELHVAYLHHAQSMQLVQLGALPDELRYLASKHGMGPDFGRKQLLLQRALRNRVTGRRIPAAVGYLSVAWKYRSRRDLSRGFGLLVGDRLKGWLSRRRPLPRDELRWVEHALDGRAT